MTHVLYFHGILHEQTVNLSLRIELLHWIYYCHIYDGITYKVYLNGQILFHLHPSPEYYLLFGNGTLILGQDQNKLSGGFHIQQILRGSIARFNIWNKKISERDIMKMSSCISEYEGNVFSFESKKIKLFDVSETKIDFCVKPIYVTLFAKVNSIVEAKDLCQNIGGNLFTPITKHENQALYKILNSQEGIYNFRTHVWLGISDAVEETIWRQFHNNITANNTFFAENEPNGKRVENCVAIGQNDNGWYDTKCSRVAPSCAPCYTGYRHSLRLGGLCVKEELETFVYVRGYVNSAPFFQAYYRYIIYWESSSEEWVLFDSITNTTKAKIVLLSKYSYPLGRKAWTVISNICDHLIDSKIILNLSPCSSEEYTCGNVKCIPIEKYCNGHSDCSDSSDEDNCKNFETPKGYKYSRPPETELGINSPVYMESNVEIIRFTAIDDVKNIISLEYELELLWKDLRLTYYNLDEKVHNNALTKRDIQALWTPQFTYPSAYNGEIETINENLRVYKSGKRKEYNLNAINAGK